MSFSSMYISARLYPSHAAGGPEMMRVVCEKTTISNARLTLKSNAHSVTRRFHFNWPSEMLDYPQFSLLCTHKRGFNSDKKGNSSRKIGFHSPVNGRFRPTSEYRNDFKVL